MSTFCIQEFTDWLRRTFPGWRTERCGTRLGWIEEAIPALLMEEAAPVESESALVVFRSPEAWRLSWIRRDAKGAMRRTSIPGAALPTALFPQRGDARQRLERAFDRRRWWRREVGGRTPEEIMARIDAGEGICEPDDGEEWLALDPSIPAALLEQDGRARRSAGVYYTPPALAAELARKAVDHLIAEYDSAREQDAALASASVLEMAVGAGGLLVAWVREVARRRYRLAETWGEVRELPALKRAAAERVYGVDPDAAALAIARWRLRREAGAEGQLCQADFLESGGWARRKFQVIIGNPPWGAEPDRRHREALKQRYPQLPALAPDRALAFVCRALELLQPEGILAALLPGAWLQTGSAEGFRRWLLERDVRELVEYGDGAFSGAVVESLLMITRQAAARASERRMLWLDDPRARIRPRVSASEAEQVMRLRQAHPAFGDLCTIRWGIKPYQVGRGVPKQTREIVAQRPFHADAPQGPEWKPLIVGGDVDRYRVTFHHTRYLRYGPWLMYPSDEALMMGPKLLLRQTCDTLRCAYDDSGLYAQNSLFLLHSTTLPLHYLLALINSRLLGSLYRMLNPQQGKIFAEIRPDIIRMLPIARGTAGEEEELATLAREVTRRAGRETAALEAEIDRRVEALYRVGDAG